ncbi:MAG TPA: DNA-formamidopyrimidine glycosylase [Cyanobacteria bacterium UBA8530]|nr:DNA-formamidopyrimidine glycosylase [Cyanobacteria bacterium UBA8530]
MPELPEVETIRRDLEPQVVGRCIRAIEKDEKRYPGVEGAIEKKIEGVGRRGKYLLFDLDELELVMHLGMTGRIGISEEKPLLRHIRALFKLDDGKNLFFNDPRRFGKIFLVEKGDYRSMPTLNEMGPEPFSDDFLLFPFSRAVAKASCIKPLLLSQKVVAGLGNIYADEALFLARIHPEQGKLGEEESKRLFFAIKEVLAKGIENRGTTLRDYRDGKGEFGDNQNFLSVFGKEDQACPACGSIILKCRVGGRGTHFCPSCQKK